MKPFLMGSETEYAVSGRNGTAPLAPGDVHALLHDALQKERLWLEDVVGGRALYLENGGRFYMDHGQHPEYATPECFTPFQVACYDKAGEQLLELARARARAAYPQVDITIHKNNLSGLAPDEITWGTHESYTSWVSPDLAARSLIPHVVSRIVYAGAGCLSAYPQAQGFELSQRSRHIVQVVGNATTGDRAIFCTRVRKMSDHSQRDGWTRAHLIGKDSQRAPFGVYLTFGTAGLLFLLLNARRQVGHGLQLANPLQALRTLSCDPWLRSKVPLADGRWLTALEIQQAYLAECEREVRGGDFPDWAQDVLGHWRQTLEALASDPLRLANRLDPYCKLLVYDHELRRAGCGWDGLRQALQDLAVLRKSYAPAVIQAVLAEQGKALPRELQADYAKALGTGGLKEPGRLDRLRLAVRLQVLDLHYHELGGLYDQLSTRGRIDNVVLGPADIEQATRQAPPGGRAAVRGDCIRAFRDGGWLCEWRYLYHEGTGEFVDLRNPFGHAPTRTSWTDLFAQHPHDFDVQEIFTQLGRR